MFLFLSNPGSHLEGKLLPVNAVLWGLKLAEFFCVTAMWGVVPAIIVKTLRRFVDSSIRDATTSPMLSTLTTLVSMPSDLDVLVVRS